MLSPRTAEVAEVVDMAVAVVAMAVVEVADFTAVAVADFVPAVAVVVVDTLWPHPSRLGTSRLHTSVVDALWSRLDGSRLDTSWLDLDPVRTSRLDIENRAHFAFGHHRHFWHGRWWYYGVGPCWVWSDYYGEYVWACD